MATVKEMAKYVRSKSAGPFWMTIDIFCENEESFERFRNTDALSRETLGRVYQVDPQLVKRFFVPDIRVIKISIPRLNPQGHRFERDMHAGQQYTLILDLEL